MSNTKFSELAATLEAVNYFFSGGRVKSLGYRLDPLHNLSVHPCARGYLFRLCPNDGRNRAFRVRVGLSLIRMFREGWPNIHPRAWVVVALLERFGNGSHTCECYAVTSYSASLTSFSSMAFFVATWLVASLASPAVALREHARSLSRL